jgi:hypothetical protein
MAMNHLPVGVGFMRIFQGVLVKKKNSFRIDPGLGCAEATY